MPGQPKGEQQNRDYRNIIRTYLISPVKAPPFRIQQFCAATWKSDLSNFFTKGRNTNGGLTTTSARKQCFTT